MAELLCDSAASLASTENSISSLLAYIPTRSVPKSFFDTLIGMCAGREAKLRIERKRILEYFRSLPSSTNTSFESNASSIFSSRSPLVTPQHSRRTSTSTLQDASRPSTISSVSGLIYDVSVTRNGRPVIDISNLLSMKSTEDGENFLFRTLEPESEVLTLSTLKDESPAIPKLVSPYRAPYYKWDPEQRQMTTSEYWNVDPSASAIAPKWKKEYERMKKSNPLSIEPTRTQKDLKKLRVRKPYEVLTFGRRPVPPKRQHQSLLTRQFQEPGKKPTRKAPLPVIAHYVPCKAKAKRQTEFALPQRPQHGRRRNPYSDSGTRLG